MEHHISRNIYINLMKKFWKTLFIYTVIIIVTALVSYATLSRRIWYIHDPEYPLLRWLHHNIFLFTVVCVLIGGVIICLFYFYRIARMIEDITEAVGIINNPSSDEQIQLPEILSDVELEMNQILTSSRENRYRVEQERKHKDDLILYLAHDLKTPLTSILGYLKLMRDEKDITETTREKYTQIALDKTHYLEELIEEFFDVTRFNNSGQVLHTETVNISRMVEQLLFEFIPLFQEKNIDYSLDCVPELSVNIDIDKFKRVIENILKNATKYSYDNSLITVVISSDKDTWQCRISNRGKTIPPEKLIYVFDRFYRVDNGSDDRNGTGLGLAIAKRIVEKHSGTISCQSKDEITTFVIDMPVIIS